MQALERQISSDNWITILLVFLLVCVFFLKVLNANKLKNTVTAFLYKSYIEDEAEEKGSFFTGFNLVLFVFTSVVLSFLFYTISVKFLLISEERYFIFMKIYLIITTYLIIKWFLEYLLSMLFLIREETRFFLVSKSIYLFSLSFFCFIAVILFSYTNLSVHFISFILFVLFFLRIIFLLSNNKKLILSELFYFILYLCAFETAPLFILFKLMF